MGHNNKLTEEEKRSIRYYCGYVDEMMFLNISKLSDAKIKELSFFEEKLLALDTGRCNAIVALTKALYKLEEALELAQDYAPNLSDTSKQRISVLQTQFIGYQKMLCWGIGVKPGPHIRNKFTVN